ncbi:MAG: orotate phosphoribosyltransferase, partial [Deltaproteobacteria bacterium CG_4_9_14_3_um_filter_44_9]
LTLVDREEGGRENLAKEGYQLEAVFTKADFLQD